MAGEAERANAYLDTIARMEPEIAMVDRDAALASISISLKRIADSLEKISSETNSYGEAGIQALVRAIVTGKM